MGWRAAWDTDGGSGAAGKDSGRKEEAKESQERRKQAVMIDPISAHLNSEGDERTSFPGDSSLSWRPARLPSAPRSSSVRTPLFLLLH